MTIFSVLSNLLYVATISSHASFIAIFMSALLLFLAIRGFGKLRLANAVLLIGFFGGLGAAAQPELISQYESDLRRLELGQRSRT